MFDRGQLIRRPLEIKKTMEPMIRAIEKYTHTHTRGGLLPLIPVILVFHLIHIRLKMANNGLGIYGPINIFNTSTSLFYELLY